MEYLLDYLDRQESLIQCLVQGHLKASIEEKQYPPHCDISRDCLVKQEPHVLLKKELPSDAQLNSQLDIQIKMEPEEEFFIKQEDDDDFLVEQEQLIIEDQSFGGSHDTLKGEPRQEFLHPAKIKKEEYDEYIDLSKFKGIDLSPLTIKKEQEFALKSETNEFNYGESRKLYMCYYCQRVWNSFNSLKACVKKCFSLYNRIKGMMDVFKNHLDRQESIIESLIRWHSRTGMKEKQPITHYGMNKEKQSCKEYIGKKGHFTNARSGMVDSQLRGRYGTYKSNPCPHCNYTSPYPGNLKVHIMAKHSSTKPYSCPHCDYSSVQSGTMKTHIQAKHTNNKPYACNVCDYRTSIAPNLRSHILAKHTSKKPYSCPLCDYACVQSGTLKNHITSMHTKNKPYSCPNCDYKAAVSRHLRAHIATKHENSKPHSCPHCSYSTAYPANLKSHITVKHTKNKSHSCPHCEFCTSVSGSLKRHIRRKHPDN